MPHPPPADALRLTLLGTGTCQLEPGRAASSVLVELPDLRLVFDLGRGVADRLVAHGLRQDDVEHLVLSHFHPDHLSDLVPYLHAAAWSRIDPRSRDLHVWGPEGVEVQLGRLLSLFEARTLRRDDWRVVVHEVTDGGIEIAGHRFGFHPLPPAGNHGLRLEALGRVAALTGDSSFHDAEVALLAGAELAVIDSGHLSDDEIVELAVASGAERIVCSHLYRELDLAELAARAAGRGYRGELVAGRDGDRFELPGRAVR